MKFQGYCVGVLNFNAPAINKKVALQIISNMEKRNTPVDFALTWGYEYTSQAYRIGLISRPWERDNINLGKIAKKLGEQGGHRKKGGGHPHVGNFYWPKKRGQDIWDLFDGNC